MPTVPRQPAADLGLPAIPAGGGADRPIFGADPEIELGEAFIDGYPLSPADQEVHDAEVARREVVRAAQLAWGRALVEDEAELRTALEAIPEVADHLRPAPSARLDGVRQLDAAVAALTGRSAEVAARWERIERLRAGLAASELTAIDVILPKFLGLGTGRAELVAAGEAALLQCAMAWNVDDSVTFSTRAEWTVAAHIEVVLRDGWRARCPPESLRVLQTLAQRRLNLRGYVLPRSKVREVLRYEGRDVDDATLFEWIHLAGIELQG